MVKDLLVQLLKYLVVIFRLLIALLQNHPWVEYWRERE